MTERIYYGVDGFEPWEVTPQAFAKLDTGSQYEVLKALRRTLEDCRDIYWEGYE
jgi:hypothetical protein